MQHMVLLLYAIVVYHIDNETREPENPGTLPSLRLLSALRLLSLFGGVKMKIIAEYNGKLGRKSYTAINGGKVVIVSTYQNVEGIHVIVSATGVKQFEFFAPCFSDEQMLQLLQTWAKAYL